MRRLLLLLAALLLATPTVRAQTAGAPDIGAAIALFAADRFADTEKAVADLAATGAPRAQAVIEALRDGRLTVDPADRAVIVRDAAGAQTDAATGAAIDPPRAGLRAVRLNNRVRRAVEAALGALTLAAPDPAKRRAAADAVFKSRDPEALAAVTAQLARETDAAAKTALAAARAAILLAKPPIAEADGLEAAAALLARGDREALALLRQMPADAPEAARAAAARAADRIESHLARLAIVQNVIYGLSLGSVLLLAAIGLAVTFGVMGVINMAHGEMVMIGAYATFVVQEAIRAYAPYLFDWSLAIALPTAFLVAALVGAAIERGVIRFLYGRPLETLLATWGVSLILQQAVRTLFGPSNREVGAPGFMSGAIDVGGLAITSGRMWIVVFALLVFAGLLLALKATPLGLQMRAVTQNRRMAAAMGIRTARVDTMTFALGSGIAGIAGVALSQIDNVSPNLGQSYIIDSFIVVVFGGVGNLWGTLVGAMSLGLANKLLEPYAGAVLGKILILVAIILFIQKRPRGLFALKGRAVEQ